MGVDLPHNGSHRVRARWDGQGRVRVARFLCLVLLLLSAVPAHAHFTAGAKAQTIILTSDGEALIRMPLPLLFADRIPEAIAARSPIDSPLLRVESTGVGSRYRLDLAAIANAPERWAARLTGTIRFDAEGVQLAPALVRNRIHGRSPGARFRSVAAATRPCWWRAPPSWPNRWCSKGRNRSSWSFLSAVLRTSSAGSITSFSCSASRSVWDGRGTSSGS